MPKLRQTALQIQDSSIRRAISGSAAFYGLSVEQQYEVIGVKRATWYRRLSDPGGFTLREIRRMALRYKWDAKTVCEFVGVRETVQWHI